MANFLSRVFQHLATDCRRNGCYCRCHIGKPGADPPHHQDFGSRSLLLTAAGADLYRQGGGDEEASTALASGAGQPFPHFRSSNTFLKQLYRTFHAFCAALLREYPIEAGLDPYFRVLDESDKIFFLRKSIARAIKELAADRTNREIYLLSAEFSRAALVGAVFTLIQKREDAGAWLTDFGKLAWPQYRERLFHATAASPATPTSW